VPHADLAGVRLWYRDSGGAGAGVVFLHAGFGHSEFFEAFQLPAFAAAGYRAIAYDRRGYGRSQSVSEEGDPVAAADDLHALVNHLKLGPFHLVATAAGGIVAVDYALTHVKQLRSLVIANSIMGVQDAEYLELGRRLRPPEFEQLPHSFRELGPEYRAANPQGVTHWIEIERRTRHDVRPTRGQAPRKRITFASLAGIDVPALLLTGDADLYSPPTAMRLCAAHLPNARFESLPAVGHSAFWEQPEAFNRLVLDFIASVA